MIPVGKQSCKNKVICVLWKCVVETRKMYGSSRNIGGNNRVVEISDYNGENDHPDFGKAKDKLKRGRR